MKTKMKLHITTHNVLVFVVGPLAVLLLVLNLYIFSKAKDQNKYGDLKNKITQSQKIEDFFDLSVKENKKRFRVGERISLHVTFDSKGKEAVGADMLVEYDPAAFTLLKSSSLDKNWSAIATQRGKIISITSAKLLGSPQGAIAKEPFVELVLLPKRRGKFQLKLIPSQGKESSKIVDSTNKAAPAQGDSMEVEIY